MKAVKKDVFDINKVTVVGSPTITEDGVASGFSSGNYITAPSNFLSANSWKIIYPISTTQTNMAGIVSILSVICMQIVFTPNSKQINYALSSNGSSWDIGTSSFQCSALDNTQDSIFVIEFTGTKYEMYFIQKGIKINGTTIVNSNKLYANSNRLVLGNNRGLSANVNGSIDLKQFSITVDGELVYSPTRPTIFLERRKEGFDLSKFTVTGSPTITSDGVASGFGVNDYVQLIDVDFSKDFKIKFSFTPDTTSYRAAIVGNAINQYSIQFIYKDNSDVVLQLSATGTDHNMYNSTVFNAPINKKMYIVFEKQGTQYSIGYSHTKEKYTYTSFVSTDNIHNCTLILGNAKQFNNGSYPFIGSMDLTDVSIELDGKEVFTGAKEKFYAIGD